MGAFRSPDWRPHPQADDPLGVEIASPAPPPRYESFGLVRSLPSLDADEGLELDALGAWLAGAELGAAARRRWREELRLISRRAGLDEASLAQASLARAASALQQSRERRLGHIRRDEQLMEAVRNEGPERLNVAVAPKRQLFHARTGFWASMEAPSRWHVDCSPSDIASRVTRTTA